MTSVLALLIAALSAPGVHSSSAAIAALRTPGAIVPDLTLPRLDGRAFRLRGVIGRPAVIVVFAGWCDPCRAELPAIVRSASRNRDVTFVGIDALESTSEARRFVRRMLIPFTTTVLTSDAFAGRGVTDAERGATGIDIPAVYVLDRRGTTVRAFVGGGADTGARVDAVLRTLRGAASRNVQPVLFAPGVISTPDDESGGSFSPDGREFYFVKSSPYTLAPRLSVICVSHYTGRQWTKPEIVSFSGQSRDFPPHLSPDGRLLFFASTRRLPNSAVRGVRIWVARRTGSGWSDPVPLPAPVNAEGSVNMDPSVAANGTLYFSSNRGDERGHLHVFRSRLVRGSYETPVKLGSAVNSSFNDVQPFISPDERVLLFASSGTFDVSTGKRPQELIAGGNPYPREDLYVSQFRGGRWTRAVHLSHGINTFAADAYPSLSPDGRYLFFSSERSIFTVPVPHTIAGPEFAARVNGTLNGGGNIYFIDAAALELDS